MTGVDRRVGIGRHRKPFVGLIIFSRGNQLLKCVSSSATCGDHASVAAMSFNRASADWRQKRTKAPRNAKAAAIDCAMVLNV